MADPKDPYAAIAEPAQSDPYAAIAYQGEMTSTGIAAPQGTASVFGKGKDESGIPLLTSQWAATKYGVGEAFKGVGDVVKGTLEMFDPRQQPGENVITQTPIYRMGKAMVEPLTHVGEIPGAVRDIVNASGENASLHALATVSPRAGGQGAGAFLPDVVGKGLNKVGEFKARFQPAARRLTESTQGAKDAVTKAAENQARDLAANRDKRIATVKDNLARQREAEYDITKGKLKTAEENKAIEAKNKTEQEAIEAKNKAQRESVAKRGELAKNVDEQSIQLRDRIESVEGAVAKEANAKFQKVRDKVGNPEVAPDELIASVKQAETQILQDIPENIKEFRSILSLEGPPPELTDAIKEHYGWEPTGNEPLTWDKLQSLKSRIDARLRTARRSRMNGDLKRALYQVRESIVGEMGNLAEANGAGDEWGAARDFWRQYKEDFHEPTGPSGSGSPVAQALDAVDPKNIRQPFLQKQAATGNRALDILRKYPQYGGVEAATLAEQLLGSHKSMTELPSKVHETPAPKGAPLKKAPEAYEMPTNKPAPPIPGKPTVDVQQVAREKIAQTAQRIGRINARDAGIIASSTVGGMVGYIFNLSGATHGASTLIPVAMLSYEIGKYMLSKTLDKPAVVEWIARTPPVELEALNNIPGVEKINIQNGITEAAVQAKTANISPELRRFLGPKNVARILSASGAVSGSQIKNRKDALTALGR